MKAYVYMAVIGLVVALVAIAASYRVTFVRKLVTGAAK